MIKLQLQEGVDSTSGKFCKNQLNMVQGIYMPSETPELKFGICDVENYVKTGYFYICVPYRLLSSVSLEQFRATC